MKPVYLCLSIFVIIIAIAFLSRKKAGNQVTAASALDMLKDPQVTILDVRTPQEFAQGHIEGARLIPVAELSDRISELDDFKNRQILVYCLRGSRSDRAFQILQKNGFSNIKQLQGGIVSWTKAGNKVVSGI